MKEGSRRAREGDAVTSRGQTDVIAGSEHGGEGHKPRNGAPSGSWKRHGMDFPHEPPEGMQCHPHFNLSESCEI